ncbi:MAG: hypothetical protein ACN4GZ_14695 [Acidimicrobiales bacterium]
MEFGSQRLSAAMYMIASAVFLLTGVLGNSGAGTAFLVLGLVFAALALNTWSSSEHPT